MIHLRCKVMKCGTYLHTIVNVVLGMYVSFKNESMSYYLISFGLILSSFIVVLHYTNKRELFIPLMSIINIFTTYMWVSHLANANPFDYYKVLMLAISVSMIIYGYSSPPPKPSEEITIRNDRYNIIIAYIISIALMMFASLNEEVVRKYALYIIPLWIVLIVIINRLKNHL